MSVSDAVKRLDVPQFIVANLEQQKIIDAYNGNDPAIGTIDDLINNAELNRSLSNKELRAREQVARILTNLGLNVQQIHIITRFTVYTLWSRGKKWLKEENVEEAKNVSDRLKIIDSLPTRLILSIFINHYRGIAERWKQDETMMDELTDDFEEISIVVAAWLRTLEEVKGIKLKQTFDLINKKISYKNRQYFKLDLSYLQLGALFSIAHNLKLADYRGNKHLDFGFRKDPTLVVEAVCTKKSCQAHYAYFLDGSNNCPYCALEEALEQVDRAERKAQRREKEAEKLLEAENA